MKLIKLLLILIIFLLCFIFPAWAINLEWKFQQANDTLNWQAASPNTKLIAYNTYLHCNSTDQRTLIASPQLMVFAEDNDMLMVTLQTENTGDGLIYFNTAYYQRFDNYKSIAFSIHHSKNMQTYYIDIKSQNPLWSGRIIQLVLNLPNHTNIKSIKLIKSSLFTRLIAGWQEFWGPQARLIRGSTINNLPSSTFSGKSINYYIYSIIVLFGIAAFIYYYFKSNQWWPAWIQTGKLLIICIFIFWVLLEISFLINQINWSKNDFNTYFGKSFNEKHSAATPPSPQLYNFIKHCQYNIPENSSFKFLSSDGFAVQKINYYLFPRIPESDNPMYIIIYRSKETVDSNIYKNIYKNQTGEIYKRKI